MFVIVTCDGDIKMAEKYVDVSDCSQNRVFPCMMSRLDKYTKWSMQKIRRDAFCMRVMS